MISVEIVDAFLEQVKNSIFTVIFVKSDGTERKMTCRFGVKKHLRGGESTISHKKNLVGVYEMNNHYRCFNKTKVLELRGVGLVIKKVG